MSVLLWWALPSLCTCLAIMNCLRADNYPPEKYYWQDLLSTNFCTKRQLRRFPLDFRIQPQNANSLISIPVPC